MGTLARTTALLLVTAVTTASAQPGAEVGAEVEVEVGAQTDADGAAIAAEVARIDAEGAKRNADAELDLVIAPPSAVPARSPSSARRGPESQSAFGTTREWGGGIRLTGLSGIGALPGVNYGVELSALVRHDEYFAELAFGWWRPEENYVVTETPDHVELAMNVWTLRGGWASMRLPLRGWLLVEAGEIAGSRDSGMGGVMARMVSGEVSKDHRWNAVGAGFGVAWPMADTARLFGMIEFAVPTNRGNLMIDKGQGVYTPEVMAARSSVGFELGWR